MCFLSVHQTDQVGGGFLSLAHLDSFTVLIFLNGRIGNMTHINESSDSKRVKMIVSLTLFDRSFNVLHYNPITDYILNKYH